MNTYLFILIILGCGAVLFMALKSMYDNIKDDEKRTKMISAYENDKYNNFMYTCPMCGSKKIKTIKTGSKMASIAITGLASNKIGKNYECDNFQYKW